jgi:ribosomal protein L37AE/L43A
VNSLTKRKIEHCKELVKHNGVCWSIVTCEKCGFQVKKTCFYPSALQKAKDYLKRHSVAYMVKDMLNEQS